MWYQQCLHNQANWRSWLPTICIKPFSDCSIENPYVVVMLVKNCVFMSKKINVRFIEQGTYKWGFSFKQERVKNMCIHDIRTQHGWCVYVGQNSIQADSREYPWWLPFFSKLDSIDGDNEETDGHIHEEDRVKSESFSSRVNRRAHERVSCPRAPGKCYRHNYHFQYHIVFQHADHSSNI